MILADSSITPAQLRTADSLAASGDLSVEYKTTLPRRAEIVNWATVFGIALGLGPGDERGADPERDSQRTGHVDRRRASRVPGAV